MPLRLVRVHHPDDCERDPKDLLSGLHVIDIRCTSRSTDVLVEADQTQGVLEVLEHAFPSDEYRVLIFPVEATVPRPEATEPREGVIKATGEIVAVEEIYQRVYDSAKATRKYFVMVALAAIVAAVGIILENVAIIIGSMVIAPLLSPNTSLSLATTLADADLARRSLMANVSALLLAFIIGGIFGLTIGVESDNTEILSRTDMSLLFVLVAFAAGVAGSISVVRGLSDVLVGVMVAVAILPPLVASGLLLGDGSYGDAGKVFVLFAVNIVCINLAGVVTFISQGIRPSTWYARKRARRGVLRALVLWAVILLALVVMIVLYKNWGAIVG
jgi:uncharacterized hydrophobic protein (TIGR00341 family)